ncbi:MAG: DUF2382 domain-containing protein [Cyanobacteria bacterium P01_G01_bin.38]
MALIKFKEAYPDYRETFGDNNEVAHFDEYSVYAQYDEKVGSVKDALFEQANGNIRYLIVDTGFWIFGKTVLLPIGIARFDYDQRRVYVDGLTKEQAEELPEYSDDMTIDRDYEDRVRSGYRALGEQRTRQFMGKEYKVDEYRAYPGSSALHGVTEAPAGAAAAVTGTAGQADLYDYDSEPGLYGMDHDAHQPIRLYQERLIADKDRFKTGEIAIGKRVETETQEVSVPVQNERIVVERTTPANVRPVTNAPDFREGEVARMETYAEQANIQKEAFVREEVSIRKEVDEEVITESETLRREELEVDAKGNPNVVKR